MAGNRVIKQGEHVARIAKEYGFADYRAIWDHPNNAELKQTRGNPNILFPGDILFIPGRVTRENPAPTDQRHKFLLKGPALKLRLVLEDSYEEPIANATCDLKLESGARQVTTDGEGRFEEEIPPASYQATLVVRDEGTPFRDVELALSIGELDPVSEISGQIARLNNLGYFADDTDSSEDPGFRSAVEEFQCDHHLTVDGICGKITQGKLRQVHGC